MKKIYIAGPIEGNPKYKIEFARAEAALLEAGWEVRNPTNNKGPEYKDWIDQGLAMLKECDAIYMLNGHFSSVGATLERYYAMAVKIPVHYEAQGVPMAEREKE